MASCSGLGNTRWLEDVPSEDDLVESDTEEDYIVESAHSTDTEQEGSDMETSVEITEPSSTQNPAFDSEDDLPLSYFINDYHTSKNGTKWKKHPYPLTRTRSQNIRTQRAGPKGAAKHASSEVECFELFFDEPVIEMITNSTNIYIDKVRPEYSRERDARRTDAIEMRAFIGMLFVIGVQKSGRRSLEDFWDTTKGTGTELIYLVMSKNRFRFLLRSIRFDDVRDREFRKQYDRLAPVRELFEALISKFQKYYVPGDFMTLDEQLVSFRGRCPFRQYIPNKPAKYGLKVFALTDTKVPYTYNLEIYAGAQPAGPYQVSNKVVDIVDRMLTPLNGLGCNVTMDNWFTNIPQCYDLLQKRITVVGTLKKNKPQIPDNFKITRRRSDNSSIFGFQKQGTLVSYKPKPNKVVLMFSTMHYDGKIAIDTGEKRKPEIITFYNNTKYGVDIVDKMCSTFDVSRNSRRWPLTVFFDLMNISAINGYVVHTINKAYSNKPRKDFLYELGFRLVAPCITRRITSEHIPQSLKMRGKLILGLNTETPEVRQPIDTRRVGKCTFCGRARNKSTRKQCHVCNKWICPEHQLLHCPDCGRNDPPPSPPQVEDISE